MLRDTARELHKLAYLTLFGTADLSGTITIDAPIRISGVVRMTGIALGWIGGRLLVRVR